jgi:hypothetical protein
MANTSNAACDLSYLFDETGVDKTGNLFAKTAFTADFGAQAEPSQLLLNTILAQNHNEKATDMQPTDLHWEPVDFIIKTAYYHQKIDKPSTTGTKLENVEQHFNALASKESLQDDVINLIDTQIKGVANKNVKPNSQEARDAVLTEDFLTNASNKLSDTFLQGKSNGDRNVEEILKDFSAVQSNIGINIIAQVNSAAYAFIKDVTSAVLTQADGQGVATLGAVNHGIIHGIVTNPGFWAKQKQAISSKLNDVVKSQVQPKYSGQYTSLSGSPQAKALFDNVFAKWKSLDENAKRCYSKFISVVDTTTLQPVVDPEKIDASNPNKYRLNFKKQNGKNLFGESLPLLPLEQVTGIWYTDVNLGKPVRVSTAGWDKKEGAKFLRELYHHIYTGSGYAPSAAEGTPFSKEAAPITRGPRSNEPLAEQLKKQPLRSQGFEDVEEQERQRLERTRGQARAEAMERDLTAFEIGGYRNLRGGMRRMRGGAGFFVFQGFTFNIAQDYETAKANYDKSTMNINAEKIIRQQLYRVVKAKPGDVPAAGSAPGVDDKQYEYADIAKNVWKRKANGDLVKTLPDGKEITYNENDPATAELLTANNNCYSTGLNLQGAECKKYIYDCIIGEDNISLDKCLKNLDNKDFYTVAKEEINNIHPYIAIRTLQRFGFRKHKVQDDKAGCQLYKIERVSHWLSTFMKTKFTTKEMQDAITGNTKLLAYLDLLAQFVNANPEVLNKDYKGKTEESVGMCKPTELAKGLDIPCRKEPSRKSGSMYEISLFKKNFDQYAVRNKQGPFQFNQMGNIYTPFGMAITPDVSLVAPVQRGGGGGGSLDWVLRRFNQESVVGGRLIKEIFKGLLKELEARGKSLNKSDLDNLDGRIQRLVEEEEELLRTLAYIEAYAELMDAFKDYSTSTLSLEDLKKHVDNRNRLKEKQMSQEQYLVKILEKVQKLLKDEGEDDGEYEKLFLNGKPAQH